MIGKYLKYSFLFLICISSFIQANIVINSSVDKQSINLNETIKLKLTVSGTNENININESNLTDFIIVKRSTSQSYKIINNEFSASQIKTYLLKPKTPGKFIIPKFSISVDKKNYSTSPITITVNDIQSTQSPPLNTQQQKASPNQEKKIPSGSSEDLFILANTNKTTAYVGEEVLYSVKLYRRFASIDKLYFQEPKFKTLIEPLERDQNTYTKRVNNKNYYVQEIARFSLFSYEKGTITIPESIADIQISFYYGNQKIKSNPISLNILELPKEGKPKDFSGLVGSFTLNSQSDTNVVIQNKPIPIRLSVSGKGNIKQLSKLNNNLDENFKVYQSDTNDQINYSKSIEGTRHFEYIAVPKQAGQFELPTFSFSYFSPKEKKYITLESAQKTINIIESGQVFQNTSEETQNKITQIQEDLRYIKTSIQLNKQHKPFSKQPLAYIFFLIDLLLIFNLLYFWINKNPQFKKLISNFAKTPKQLAFASFSKIPLENNPHIMLDIQKPLFKYLSSILKKPAHALPKHELISLLADKKINPIIIKDLEIFLETCAMISYAPDNNTNSSTHKELLNKALSIVKRISK